MRYFLRKSWCSPCSLWETLRHVFAGSPTWWVCKHSTCHIQYSNKQNNFTNLISYIITLTLISSFSGCWHSTSVGSSLRTALFCGGPGHLPPWQVPSSFLSLWQWTSSILHPSQSPNQTPLRIIAGAHPHLQERQYSAIEQLLSVIDMVEVAASMMLPC